MNWYCIHTRPQKEHSTCQYFQESLDLETYAPRLREQRIIRRARRIVARPLFPRYVFCRFEPALHYRAVRYAPEVIDIVHCGAAPIIVSDHLVEELRGWAGEDLDRSLLKPALRPGDLVIIGGGPLLGLRAVVQHEMSANDRVAVLLSFLDCGARAVLPRTQLRLVG